MWHRYGTASIRTARCNTGSATALPPPRDADVEAEGDRKHQHRADAAHHTPRAVAKPHPHEAFHEADDPELLDNLQSDLSWRGVEHVEVADAKFAEYEKKGYIKSFNSYDDLVAFLSGESPWSLKPTS